MAAMRVSEGEGTRTHTWVDIEERVRLYRTLGRGGRRRVKRDDDFYRTVAELYREGLVGGNPTEHVAGRLGYSRAAAARWVMETRRRGFLGRTQPGVAGEIGEEDE